MKFEHENLLKKPMVLCTNQIDDLSLDCLITSIALTYCQLRVILSIAKVPRTIAENKKILQLIAGDSLLQKMKGWMLLLLQYLLRHNRSLTGEDSPVTEKRDYTKYRGVTLLTDSAFMMRIDLLAPISWFRELVTVVCGPRLKNVLHDVQLKAYRNSFSMLT